ncbi:putative protein kinase [Artemisia annua]|uniref:Uncharacterized protein n=1 Tax=Artemisia annua TaxID=35608 RepID=A0A2U1PUU1_ARTAN|nr:putative protein kinase [Artemisia annua]
MTASSSSRGVSVEKLHFSQLHSCLVLLFSHREDIELADEGAAGFDKDGEFGACDIPRKLLTKSPRLSEDKEKQCVAPKLNDDYPPKAVAKIGWVYGAMKQAVSYSLKLRVFTGCFDRTMGESQHIEVNGGMCPHYHSKGSKEMSCSNVRTVDGGAVEDDADVT